MNATLAAVTAIAFLGLSACQAEPPGAGTAQDGSPSIDQTPDRSTAPEVTWTQAAPDVMAARLARFLWDTEADDTLRQRLSSANSPAEVARLAREMLADPRARQGVG